MDTSSLCIGASEAAGVEVKCFMSAALTAEVHLRNQKDAFDVAAGEV